MNFKRGDIRKGDNGFEVHYEAEAIEDSKMGGGQLATNKRKNTVKIFTFNLPSWLTPFVDEYLEMSPDNGKRFLRNPVKNSGKRTHTYVQNLGRNNFANWGKDLAKDMKKLLG